MFDRELRVLFRNQAKRFLRNLMTSLQNRTESVFDPQNMKMQNSFMQNPQYRYINWCILTFFTSYTFSQKIWNDFKTSFLFIFSGSCGNPDAKRLYDDLLSNYNKLVRPVVNVTDAVTVRLKLKLSQLIDVVSDFWHFSKNSGPFRRYLATFCQFYRQT